MVAKLEEVAAPHSTFDTILVLDFGSQTSHLILRRLRSLNVYAEMLPCTTKLADLPWKPVGIVLSGGPSSVYDEVSPHVDPAIFDMGVPILGICYGCQEIAWRINDKNVQRGEKREYGQTDVDILTLDGQQDHVNRLFEGVEANTEVTMSHFDKLVHLPEGFVTIASTPSTPYAGIAHKEKPIFGIQFHPEISHTKRGMDILGNFATKICKARDNWKMENFIEKEIIRIRKLVGENAQVIGAVSGGVDSTVAARLMKEAIGDRFHAILVDTGLMRLNECEQVKKSLSDHLNINLTIVDGAELFFSRLAGVTEPEAKRKIIGGTFIDLFEKEAIRIEEEAKHTPHAGKVEWFLQGTLYPDLIESLSWKGPSATIKSHHNVGGLPARMMNGQGLKLIEPLRELFKDEVREFGRQLGIHEELIMRHPFPGPGIGIRILGEVTPERVELVRQADHIFISSIREAGIYNEMSQAFAALDTSRAVGVMGDSREYGYICILRAVSSVDFMSAEPYAFDSKLILKIANRIPNEVHGITRVVYDYTGKPPGTIELE
ncbi:GMP synthase [Pestalotiopsis fici W106-1]|uniref:GMP synthase [glutamine-hydrolyzing] n=1 Tax=Pestalotiopsis fici (strain W106-1 / CGMCC3.15140) TaxID=1229662 RepID=W3XAK1_PESFW|nr:GMP synthase [Pestalotiopsis fici W106-1]ETS83123.1 GMP synthase [Pestalotiopsis fici W106-1]